MTASQFLLMLRFVELLFITGCFGWLVWCFPPSRLRTVRLCLAMAIILINLTAIILAVSWAKISLW